MSIEVAHRFRCFGGDCAVLVAGRGPHADAPAAVLGARRQMADWHGRFSRFRADSELSRLNRDPRSAVPASATMLALVDAAVRAARATGGLVDPTVLPALRDAGYGRSRQDPAAPPAVTLGELLAQLPTPRPAAPDPAARWSELSVDLAAETVIRPPGIELDGGGIAKGLFGDLLALTLRDHDSFAVDACGDVRIGGRRTRARPIAVAGLSGEGVLHTFHLLSGAVATSGIGRRAWRADDGSIAHHLLDPASGRPAWTGLVQVTALAPTGVEAEARAKAALLSGPAGAVEWLSDGGLTVAWDGTVTVLEPSAAMLDHAAVDRLALR